MMNRRTIFLVFLTLAVSVALWLLRDKLELFAVLSIPLALVLTPLGATWQTIKNYRRNSFNSVTIICAGCAAIGMWLAISFLMMVALYAAWHDPSGQKDTSNATVLLSTIYVLLGGITVYALRFLRKPKTN